MEPVWFLPKSKHIYSNYTFWNCVNNHRISLGTYWTYCELDFSQTFINQLTWISPYLTGEPQCFLGSRGILLGILSRSFLRGIWMFLHSRGSESANCLKSGNWLIGPSIAIIQCSLFIVYLRFFSSYIDQTKFSRLVITHIYINCPEAPWLISQY